MYPEKKGSLRNLSTLINDGNKPCSWVCRISFTNNEWTISIAPHSEIDKSNIDINIFEKINQEFNNQNEIYINGNLHVVFLKTKNKEYVEKIVNYIISIFYNLEILGIRKFTINNKFNIKNSQGPYILSYEYNNTKTNKANQKTKRIIESLEKHNLTNDELNKIIKIKDNIKNNKQIDLDYLNSLSLKYCSDKERLQIAIKFMS
jgi:hypothetical protein